MHCKHRGSHVVNNERFCIECGTQLPLQTGPFEVSPSVSKICTKAITTDCRLDSSQKITCPHCGFNKTVHSKFAKRVKATCPNCNDSFYIEPLKNESDQCSTDSNEFNSTSKTNDSIKVHNKSSHAKKTYGYKNNNAISVKKKILDISIYIVFIFLIAEVIIRLQNKQLMAILDGLLYSLPACLIIYFIVLGIFTSSTKRPSLSYRKKYYTFIAVHISGTLSSALFYPNNYLMYATITITSLVTIAISATGDTKKPKQQTTNGTI